MSMGLGKYAASVASRKLVRTATDAAVDAAIRQGKKMYYGTSKRRSYASGGTRYRRPPYYVYREYGAKKELKYLDSVAASTTVSVSGTEYFSTSGGLTVPNGPDSQERIGRKIMLKKVMFRGKIVLNEDGDAADTFDRVRMMLIWDRQCNGTNVGLSTVLTSAQIDQYNELQKGDRFKILWEKIVVLNRTTGVDDSLKQYGKYGRSIFMAKKCNIPITYQGTNGNVTERFNNNLVWYAISDFGQAAISGTFRIRYTD